MDIDCVYDNMLAEELATYLRKKGHFVITQESIISTKSDPIDDVVNFTVETKRHDYHISFFENTLILARKIQVEKMGLLACKQCGFLAKTKSDLEYHQDTHLPKNWIYHHR